MHEANLLCYWSIYTEHWYCNYSDNGILFKSIHKLKEILIHKLKGKFAFVNSKRYWPINWKANLHLYMTKSFYSTRSEWNWTYSKTFYTTRLPVWNLWTYFNTTYVKMCPKTLEFYKLLLKDIEQGNHFTLGFRVHMGYCHIIDGNLWETQITCDSLRGFWYCIP